MKRITLKDIARMSGFSEKTVSRVINEEKGVKKNTREKILKIIQKYNYRPNLMAKGLVSKRTYTIGLVVANISNPAISKIIETLEHEISNTNYSFLLCIANEHKEKQCIYTLVDKMVDGVIFVAVGPQKKDLKYLQKNKIPFVLMTARIKSFDTNYVGVDNEYGSKSMMHYLFDIGCRTIGFIKGPAYASGSNERFNGYRNFLREKKVPYNIELVAKGNYKYDGGFKAFHKIISKNKNVQAVFCANDYMALGAIDGAEKIGLKVPQDIRIVGFDDIPISAHSHIKLTTIRLPYTEMAQSAIKILLEDIDKKSLSPRKEIILKPELMIRDFSRQLY